MLVDLERARCNGFRLPSLSLACPALRVVGYVCNIDGRYLDTAKVIKILKWPAPTSVCEARAFVGVVVYYRI